MRHDILTTSTMCSRSRRPTHIAQICWSPGGRCRSNVAPREHMYCQARSIARYHCRSHNKTVQETESRFRSAGYYGTEFRSRRVTTEDKQVQQPPLTILHRMQSLSSIILEWRRRSHWHWLIEGSETTSLRRRIHCEVIFLVNVHLLEEQQHMFDVRRHLTYPA